MKYKYSLLVLFLQTISVYASWHDHEEAARYAIVQVVNHANTINQFEPFKRTHEEKSGGGSGFFINEDG